MVSKLVPTTAETLPIHGGFTTVQNGPTPGYMHANGRETGTPLLSGVEEALERIAIKFKLTPVLRIRLFEIALGYSYSEIAAANGITVNTVKTEIGALLRRIGVMCRHEIEHAVWAAYKRCRRGASALELYQFLCIRFE